MIDELCGFESDIAEELEKLRSEYAEFTLAEFAHPLDKDIIGENGLLKKLLNNTNDSAIAYSNSDQLDELWRVLLQKAIVCLRYFDRREPFLKSSQKTIVAYGLDKLTDYHKRYTDFESLMYGASSYYRDHVFHAIRVWFLGVFCLMKPMAKTEEDPKEPFYSHITLDGGATLPNKINFFETISMWTIIALCHDLGYPLEKSEQILDKTRNMMKEFIPSPNIWNNFGYSGVQDNINEYILKFISTKMKEHKPDDKCKQVKEKGQEEEPETQKKKEYMGRIQPKYYLKYAKSLEHFQHGIISAVIIYKMLLYFLESDFNLNDDYIYEEEDARQFYIRREILRAIASHTCPDAYNIHITTFSSLLFLCDELQEWGRKSWNELYTGLSDSAISLEISCFEPDEVNVSETITMSGIKDDTIVIQNIVRVFQRQYSLYKTTFRDGQDTAKRDFGFKKTMHFVLSTQGAAKRNIKVNFVLPATGESCFTVDISELTLKDKKTYGKEIEEKIKNLLYGEDLCVQND